MENKQYSISTKQMILLTSFMNMCVLILMTPILLLKSAERSAIIVILMYVLFDILQAVIFLLADKFSGGKNIYELLESLIGKIGAKIVSIVIMAYSIFKIMLFLLFIKNFISTGLFEGVKWEIFIIPLVLLFATFALSSMRSLGRTAEMFFIFIAIAGILLIFFISEGLDLAKLMPLGDNSDEIGRSFMRYPMWFGNYFLTAMYLGRIKKTKRYKLAVTLALVITAITILVSALIILSTYIDVMHVLDFNKKTSSIAQTNVSRLNAGRLDLVFFSIQIISIILIAGQFFYFSSRSAEYLLDKKKPSRIVAAVLCVIIYILSVFIFVNEGVTVYVFTKIINVAALVLQAGLPLLALIAALITRRRGINAANTQKEITAV